MSTIEVEPAALEAAAATLRSAAEELRWRADQIGGALQVAGHAAGSTALAAGGAEAGRRWGAALGQYAEAAEALATATTGCAEGYEFVEGNNQRALTTGAGW